jgi:myo-inositol-1(or 4)-monophosphatase
MCSKEVHMEKREIMEAEWTRQAAENFQKKVYCVSGERIIVDLSEYPEAWQKKEFDYLCRVLDFAACAHKGTTRKGTNIPYIVHPIEAALIVMTMCDDPYVSAAALLHDVVEDTECSIDDIKYEFGEKIAELVADESEDKMRDIAAADSWKLRKKAFLDHLKSAPIEAKMICLADKLSNMRMSANMHRVKGDEMWQIFNQKDKREQEWYYRSIYENLLELADTAAYKEYVELCNQVFV